MNNLAKRIGRRPIDLNVILVVYVALFALATVQKILLGPFEFKGFSYLPLQNFVIFRNSFFHLIHHQDIYAAFPLEQWDLFKYSPAFALLMAPFALLPYAAGAVLWNLFNALALFFAIRSVPGIGRDAKAFILWFIILNLLGSVQNAQSNGLTAALMIGAFSAKSGDRNALSGLFIALAAFIKLFGAAAVLPCLLLPGRRKLIGWTVLWAFILALTPLAAVSFQETIGLYRRWNHLLHADYSAKTGLSVMSLLNNWTGLHLPSGPIILAGAVLLIVPLLRGLVRPGHDFVVQATASVLIWVIIFNHMAESPTLVIAVSGVALWYFSQPRTVVNTVLAVLVFLLTCLSPTEICPPSIRRSIIMGHVLITAPCMAVWLKIQFDLLRLRTAAVQPAPAEKLG